MWTFTVYTSSIVYSSIGGFAGFVVLLCNRRLAVLLSSQRATKHAMNKVKKPHSSYISLHITRDVPIRIQYKYFSLSTKEKPRIHHRLADLPPRMHIRALRPAPHDVFTKKTRLNKIGLDLPPSRRSSLFQLAGSHQVDRSPPCSVVSLPDLAQFYHSEGQHSVNVGNYRTTQHQNEPNPQMCGDAVSCTLT